MQFFSSFYSPRVPVQGETPISSCWTRAGFFFSCQLPDSHGGKKKCVLISASLALLLASLKRKPASYFCYSSFPPASFLQDPYLLWITPVPVPGPGSSFYKLQHEVRGLAGLPCMAWGARRRQGPCLGHLTRRVLTGSAGMEEQHRHGSCFSADSGSQCSISLHQVWAWKGYFCCHKA